MVVEGEEATAVEAHDLEDAVAAQKPLVRGGNLRLRGVGDGAVEDGEHGANASPPRLCVTDATVRAAKEPFARGVVKRTSGPPLLWSGTPGRTP